MKSIKTKFQLIIFASIFTILATFFLTNKIYNKSYYDLKQSEIRNIVHNNIDEINKLIKIVEKNVENISAAGGVFYNLKMENPEKNFDEHIKNYVMENCFNNPDTLGQGLWFD